MIVGSNALRVLTFLAVNLDSKSSRPAPVAFPASNTSRPELVACMGKTPWVRATPNHIPGFRKMAASRVGENYRIT
jgi:hypothetical protein